MADDATGWGATRLHQISVAVAEPTNLPDRRPGADAPQRQPGSPAEIAVGTKIAAPARIAAPAQTAVPAQAAWWPIQTAWSPARTSGPSGPPAVPPATPPAGPRFVDPFDTQYRAGRAGESAAPARVDLVVSSRELGLVGLPEAERTADSAPATGTRRAPRPPESSSDANRQPGGWPSVTQLARDVDRWGLQPALLAPRPQADGAPLPPQRSRPRRARRRGLIAAVVVLLAAGLGIGGLEIFGRSAAPAPGPAAVVQTYLSALGTDNAEQALAQGATQPVVSTYLTDAALIQQRSRARLTNIQVGHAQVTGSSAQVVARYSLGSQSVFPTFALSKIKGRWRLRDTTITIGVSALATLPDLTLFGQPVTTPSVQVFPGPLSWGTLDTPYLAIVDQHPDAYPTSPSDTSASVTPSLTAQVTTQGSAAAATAVAGYLHRCAALTTAVPPASEKCPQSLEDPAYNNTAYWNVVTQSPALQLHQDTQSGQTATYTVSGQVKWTATYYQVVDPNGARGKHVTVTVAAPAQGTIDFSQRTPGFAPAS